MLNVIYHVHFTASSTDMGQGLVVNKNGSINGGEAAYIYARQLTENEKTSNADQHREVAADKMRLFMLTQQSGGVGANVDLREMIDEGCA